MATKLRVFYSTNQIKNFLFCLMLISKFPSINTGEQALLKIVIKSRQKTSPSRRKTTILFFCAYPEKFVKPSLKEKKISNILGGLVSIQRHCQMCLWQKLKNFGMRSLTLTSLFSVYDTGMHTREKKIRVLLLRSRTWALPITSSDALLLSYRRLVRAKAIKLGSWNKHSVYCLDLNVNV